MQAIVPKSSDKSSQKSVSHHRNSGDEQQAVATRDSGSLWRGMATYTAGTTAEVSGSASDGSRVQTKPKSSVKPTLVQRLCAECDQEQQGEVTRIQPKLTIGAPNDPYEQEADAVADTVMRSPHTASLNQNHSIHSKPVSLVQRLCATCEQPPDTNLQAKSTQTSQANSTHNVHSLIASPDAGAPLSDNIRNRVEPVVGADLSNVRVHSDRRSQTAASDIQAKAFTHQNNIYLGAGQSSQDVALMAHESTHVVQQGAASSNRVQAKPQTSLIQRDSDDGIFSSIGSTIVSGGSALVSAGQRGVEVVGQGIDTALEIGGEIVSTGAGMARDALIALIERLAPGAINFFRNIKNFVKDKATAGFNALFGGLPGRFKKDGIAGALEFIFVDLIGGVWKGIGSVFGASCSAMASVAQVLLDIGMKLGGEAVAAISKGASALSGFLGDLWDRFATPALGALSSFASGIWEDITEIVGGWWEALEPVRSLASEAWDLFVSTFMAGKQMISDLMTDLFTALAEKWEEIKAEILPYMTYVKIVIGILLLMSPMGPFIAAGVAAYGLYALVSYLWQAFGQPLVSETRRYIVNNIMPVVMAKLEALEGLIDDARVWLSGMVDGLAAMGMALLSAIGALSFLRFARQLFSNLSDAFQSLATKVKLKLAEVTAAISALFAAAMVYLRPIFEFMRRSLLLVLFGPFALLDDGVWEMVQSLAQFALSTPCIREIAGLMQLPLIMRGAEAFRNMLKAAWEIIQNPQPIIDALHDAIQPMVEAVPGVAAGVIATALYPNEIQHRQGVERHLLPAIQHLQENWWDEIKKMLWTMIWPWDEVAEKIPHMIEKGTDAVNSFFELEISTAIDKFLAMMQDVNTILGAIWGWFAIAAVLIGGVLGALGVEFSAGATIGAGMAAGWAVAETVGLVLLGAMAATEFGIIGKSAFDLRFNNTLITDVNQRAQENDKDYQSIANSTFTIAVVTALVILGAAAQKLASSIWKFAKARVPGLADATNAINTKVRAVLDEPRGPNARNSRGRGDTPEPGSTTNRNPDGDAPSNVSPEELARSNERLRNEIRNPENIRDVADPNFVEKYDVEVTVGDHTYRRSRRNGTWCRFSKPTCGIELGDVNNAVDRVLGERPPLSDQYGRVPGRVNQRPIPESGVSVEVRRNQGGNIPDRVAANELDWYFDTRTRTYNKRPSRLIDPNTGNNVGARPSRQQLFDAEGRPINGPVEPGQALFDARGNRVDAIPEYRPVLDEFGNPVTDPGVDISLDVRSGNRTKPTGEGWTHAPNWEKWTRESGGRIAQHSDGSYTFTSRDGTRVRYSPDGEPNFRPHLRENPWGVRNEVTLDRFVDRPTDFKAANIEAGIPQFGDRSPPGFTWHHVRGEPPRLQLVPRNIHDSFSHSGGIAHNS